MGHLIFVAASNYNISTVLCNLQITAAFTKHSHSAMCSRIRYLVTVSHNGYYSASMVTSLPAGSCPTTDSYKSKSKLSYDLRSVSQSVLVSSPIFSSRTDFCYCQTVAYLMMWGTLSDERMDLLFTIAAGACPTRLMTIFYGLRFETSPAWRARSLYVYPPGTGWPSHTPRHWVSFLLPPVTLRVTVEVFEPASAWAVTLTGVLVK
jgi:hypothetical protein